MCLPDLDNVLIHMTLNSVITDRKKLQSLKICDFGRLTSLYSLLPIKHRSLSDRLTKLP